MYRILLASVGLLLLSGCAAGLGEEFSCDKVGGVKGCTSMNEIRENIDAYSTPNGFAPPSPAVTNVPQPNVFATLPRRDRHGQPSRTEDNVRKITIFPFETTAHNHYIDTLDIFFVLDESRWTGKPAQAILKD